MNRRSFLAGLTATGLLVPERKVWALDRTMVTPRLETGVYQSDVGVIAVDDRGYYYPVEGVYRIHRDILRMGVENAWGDYRDVSFHAAFDDEQMLILRPAIPDDVRAGDVLVLDVFSARRTLDGRNAAEH